jgi:hypothetical protein
MYDADATAASNNRLAVTGKFYTADGRRRHADAHHHGKYIREQFDTNTNIIQYACQRNNVHHHRRLRQRQRGGPAVVFAVHLRRHGALHHHAGSSLADKALAYFTLRLRRPGLARWRPARCRWATRR